MSAALALLANPSFQGLIVALATTLYASVKAYSTAKAAGKAKEEAAAAAREAALEACRAAIGATYQTWVAGAKAADAGPGAPPGKLSLGDSIQAMIDTKAAAEVIGATQGVSPASIFGPSLDPIIESLLYDLKNRNRA